MILTNSDSGVALRGALQRRLLEVLFDGKPEAEESLRGIVGRRKAAIAKEREIDPSVAGFEFVVADKDGKRQLVTRDAQHEYVFGEQSPPPPPSN